MMSSWKQVSTSSCVQGYEERFYPSRLWVCTRSGSFMDLFRYISGANSRSQKIDMTVPVMSTYNEKVG